MTNPTAIITWPGGTAALDLHALVQTVLPVFVEVAGERFKLTDWDEAHGMFTAVGPLAAPDPTGTPDTFTVAPGWEVAAPDPTGTEDA